MSSTWYVEVVTENGVVTARFKMGDERSANAFAKAFRPTGGQTARVVQR